MTDFYIDHEQGRIGEFWWINSEPSKKIHAGNCIVQGLRRTYVAWGTCGYGRDIKISLEPIDD
jgi:hypothetical protein